MRKIIFLFLLATLATSCGYNPGVRLGVEGEEFVVKKYESSKYGFRYVSTENYVITLPYLYFGIGDTISFSVLDPIVNPRFNAVGLADSAKTGLAFTFMHVDSVFLPEGISLKYVDGKLYAGFDLNRLGLNVQR